MQTASGSYTAPSQFFSVENADMTIDTLENDNVEFDLDASTGVESLATMTDGGRGEPEGVELNNVGISERASLGNLHAADNGWYYDNSDNTIYVKTIHASTNSVSIDWGAEAATSTTAEEESPILTHAWSAFGLISLLPLIIFAVLIVGIVVGLAPAMRGEQRKNLTADEILKVIGVAIAVSIIVALGVAILAALAPLL